MKKIACGLILLSILLGWFPAFGQGVRIDPNGEFSEQTLSLPYAFYNESFSSDTILVAVDNSEYSLRAVDHVSFMAGDNEATYLTFYHIKPKGADMSQVEFDEQKSAELEK